MGTWGGGRLYTDQRPRESGGRWECRGRVPAVDTLTLQVGRQKGEVVCCTS